MHGDAAAEGTLRVVLHDSTVRLDALSSALLLHHCSADELERELRSFRCQDVSALLQALSRLRLPAAELRAARSVSSSKS